MVKPKKKLYQLTLFSILYFALYKQILDSRLKIYKL